jgi:hypothetical protein
MAEQQEVIAGLCAAGILDAIRWAYQAAVRRSLETYCEADGHDHAWLGMTRFTLFRDRLDRVFGCERYAPAGVSVGGEAADPDPDLRYARLSGQDLETLPRIPSGLVVRADLYGSAGWSCPGLRFLLAAGEFGRLHAIPWSDRVALRPPAAERPRRARLVLAGGPASRSAHPCRGGEPGRRARALTPAVSAANAA